jgi:hypothetical protein
VMPHALGGYELVAALAVGLFMAGREPRLRVWLLGAGAFLLLALGPELKFTGIPLPFALLGAWPPLEHFRSPYRLTIPAVIGIAAAGAVVLDRVLARRSFRAAMLVVAAALPLRVDLAMVQHPLATQRYPEYDVYRRIAEERTRSTLIEAPFGVRSGIDRIGTGGEYLQYYQPMHRRPIMNAMVARLPTAVFESYRAHPSLMLLAGDDVEASDEVIARDFDAVLERSHAGYVIAHQRLMAAGLRTRVERLFDSHPRLERWAIEGDLLAYRVVAPRPR